jgi:transposase-like protein
MKRRGQPRDTAKERFWREAIRQQQRSGQSVREYCRAQQVSEPSFYAWRRELQRRSPRAGGGRGHAGGPAARSEARPAFVSVELAADAAPIASASIECLLPGGIVLRMPPSMAPAAIAAVLRSWEQPPC